MFHRDFKKEWKENYSDDDEWLCKLIDDMLEEIDHRRAENIHLRGQINELRRDHKEAVSRFVKLRGELEEAEQRNSYLVKELMLRMRGEKAEVSK